MTNSVQPVLISFSISTDPCIYTIRFAIDPVNLWLTMIECNAFWYWFQTYTHQMFDFASRANVPHMYHHGINIIEMVFQNRPIFMDEWKVSGRVFNVFNPILGFFFDLLNMFLTLSICCWQPWVPFSFRQLHFCVIKFSFSCFRMIVGCCNPLQIRVKQSIAVSKKFIKGSVAKVKYVECECCERW